MLRVHEDARRKESETIETYRNDQLEYVIPWDEAFWHDIEMGLKRVVRQLNRIEHDPALREQIVELLL